MMVWFIFDKWKVNSTVCVEPFLQPMHMTVFSQLVISPAPISLKGNLVEDWTYLREKTWKKVLTNNPQNSVLGKETYQKAKNLLVGDHSLHCWALLIQQCQLWRWKNWHKNRPQKLASTGCLTCIKQWTDLLQIGNRIKELWSQEVIQSINTW